MFNLTKIDIASLIANKTPPNPQINIAIAGGSGSGKTSIAKLLKSSSPCNTKIISLDIFFKDTDKLPKYYSKYHQNLQADYNHPNSLEVAEMLAYCQTISGYDLVIFDGHFALYYPEVRKLMDINIFVDVKLTAMLERRSKRNLENNYGGSETNIFHYNQECVTPSYQKYILPTKKYADIILDNNSNNTKTRDETIAQLAKQICSRINNK